MTETELHESTDLAALILDHLDPALWESVGHARGICDAAVLRMIGWRYPVRPATSRIAELRNVVTTIARSVHAAKSLAEARDAAEWHRGQLPNGTIRPDVTITLAEDGIVTRACGGEFSGKLSPHAGEEPTELDAEMAAVVSLLPLISKFVVCPEQITPHRLAIEQLSRVLAEVSQS